MSDPNGGHSSVIIAGAGSGIGLATTRRLLNDWPDLKIVAADLLMGDLKDVQAEFGKDRIIFCEADIASALGAAEVVEKAVRWSGKLSGLVVCAGNSTNHSSLEMTTQEWRQVLDCHLDGHFYMNQAFARYLVSQREGGAIVNFSSVAHHFAWPRRLPYAVAKAGINALTRTLAVEWAEYGIRINAIAPGYVNTPLVATAQAAGFLDPSLVDMHAMKRFADPDEIASGVKFLLSDDASFITGEILMIDGGFSVKRIPWNNNK